MRSAEQPYRSHLVCVAQEQIVVLHGFIKKTKKTPDQDLALARKRRNEFEA